VDLLSGLIATVPMTIWMATLFRKLPKREQYPLPPREITMEVAEKTGIKEKLDEPERKGITLVAHFGYGTAMGFIYSLFSEKVPGLAVLKGIIFGLIVWAGSYLLLLPALGILRLATKHPLRRNQLMISAHVIWGGFLGLIVQWLKQFQ
jgi:uncharacterized membrane protein YagU involved in acid resistance